MTYTALLFLEDRVMEDMVGMVSLTRFVVGYRSLANLNSPGTPV